ncbi:MAG: STAS domain-containing protein [Spirochaetota bacterium]
MKEAFFQIIDEALIATIPRNTTDAGLGNFREQVLQSVHLHEVYYVIFDFSDLSHIDRFEFVHIQKIKDMLQLMGVKILFSGLKAGIVSTLVALDFDVESIDSYLNLSTALNAIREFKKADFLIMDEFEQEEIDDLQAEDVEPMDSPEEEDIWEESDIAAEEEIVQDGSL